MKAPYFGDKPQNLLGLGEEESQKLLGVRRVKQDFAFIKFAVNLTFFA